MGPLTKTKRRSSALKSVLYPAPRLEPLKAFPELRFAAINVVLTVQCRSD
jgi:hypothetical protein